MADEKQRERTLREAFDMHDKEGKEFLGVEELGSALRSVGKRLTEDGVAQMRKKAQDECGGKIAFSDFKHYVTMATSLEKQDSDVEQAFHVFGGQRGLAKNTIDIAEFRQALTTLGDRLTKQEVDDFLKEAGHANRSNISLESFMKVVQSSRV